ncbi:major facilitator superfamily domain-containing protein [Mrakia frigida]|uniref:major facilitator superfamily domain-containing protein n=1 Tax=Mrakia frigida TaxID=29902 RepID=UPI003FCC0D23
MSKKTVIVDPALPPSSREEKSEVLHREMVSEEGLKEFQSNTTDQTSSAYAELTAENRKAERRLVRKLDVLILPLAVLLYLSAYLDRGNLGNAKLQGLQASVLGGSDLKYSIALMVFFIFYIVLSVPGTLLAKAFNPSTTISLGAILWSIGATCQAGATNPAGLYVCRAFVGIGEAMFGQAIAFYLTYWYKKEELAKRVGLFISAGSLAGAFGGLISFGVSSITNSKIPQWRILFLIEGIPSFILAIVVFFCLPDRPHVSKYLNEDERVIALTRLNSENLGESSVGIDKKAVIRAFTDWKTYAVSIAYSCMNLGLGSVSAYLPTIIKGLGYTNAEAQLYTVPPYAVSLVFMLMVTTISDRYQQRAMPIMMVFLVGVVGWSLLLGVSPVGATEGALRARYFGCFCVVAAGYTNIPLIISWQAGNTGAQTQRAVSLGMLNTVGQSLAILAAFLFPSLEGPKFIKGASINVAFQGLGFFITLGMYMYYKTENNRRDRREGGRPAPGTKIDVVNDYDLAVGFRYTP